VTAYVLVHGAWHGGWCWQRVASRLELAGAVYAPSLRGLADRADLLSRDIDVETHVQEVVKLLRIRNLHDVVLVGHSYGGAVITGVADCEPGRLAAIVYLDAFMPDDGDTLLGLSGGQDDGGEVIPPPPAEFFGLDGDDARWVQEQMTPQPAGCIRQVIRLKHADPRDGVSKRLYVRASGWAGVPHFAECYDRLSVLPGWITTVIDGSHDLMVDRPQEISELISGLA
jgi:pimeloyl-ACP methyl ester carboxylesterase